jgi:hypothetical protein
MERLALELLGYKSMAGVKKQQNLVATMLALAVTYAQTISTTSKQRWRRL